VAPVTANFLRILLQHNRIRYFAQIREHYLKAANEMMGIVSVRVTSAAELSDKEAKDLAEQLGKITGKRVDVELETDEALLGGIVVQLGSTIFDGSIRTQLAEMKRRLAEA
jgi:F-type H+-transporting ATPase subunit delta